MRLMSPPISTGRYRWLQATSSAEPALYHFTHENCKSRIIDHFAVAGHEPGRGIGSKGRPHILEQGLLLASDELDGERVDVQSGSAARQAEQQREDGVFRKAR